MEFAYQQKYWPTTVHFTWARKLNRWFIFSTSEALKYMIRIKHIKEIPAWIPETDQLLATVQENIENLPAIHQLLPQVRIDDYIPGPDSKVGSFKDSLVLDIKKIKQLDRWLNLFSLR